MKYKVNMTRIGYANLDIEVEAATLEEAKELALDKAGDQLFSEHESEYEVLGVQEQST